MSEKLIWHHTNSGKSRFNHVTIQVVGDEGHWILNGPARPKGSPEMAADIERVKKIIRIFNEDANLQSLLTAQAERVKELEKEIVFTRRQGEDRKDNSQRQLLRAEAAESLLRERDERIAGLEKVKNGAYSERNKMVAALSKIFPASLERHDGAEWEDDWRWVVFMDLPTGQVSWHLHDSEIPQFAHLPRQVGRKWDGHSTDEKYARLAAISSTPAPSETKPESKENR